MKIVIIGGGGFIGQKLAQKLADTKQINGQTISKLVLADIQKPGFVNGSVPVEYKSTG